MYFYANGSQNIHCYCSASAGISRVCKSRARKSRASNIRATLAAFCWLFLLWILIFSPSLSHAHNQDLLSMSLEELLDVKITGASLREQNIRNIPASVNTFTAKGIEFLGAETVQDLFRFVPGFQSYRGGDFNSESIVSRGKTSGPASREILFIVDGVRMDSWYLGSSLFVLGRYPLVNVERVEFIRGPVSQIYGSNAFQGLINVVTKDQGKNVTVGLGSEGNQRIALSYQLQHHQLNLEWYEDNGQEYLITDPFDTGSQVEITDPIHSLLLHYKYRHKDWLVSAWRKEYEAEDFLTGNRYNPDFSRFEFQQNAVNAKFDKHVSDVLHLTLNAGVKNYESSQYSGVRGEGELFFISNPPSTEPLNTIFEYQGEGAWLDLNGVYATDSAWVYQMGFEIRYDEVDAAYLRSNYNMEQLITRDFPVDYYGNYDNTSLLTQAATESVYGLMGLASYRQERYELMFGLRADHSKNANDNFSPRFNANYYINDAHTLKLIYGEAFRPPTAIEYFIQPNTASITGNPDLKAETVASTELIWLYDINHQRIQLSFFDNQFDGTISQNNPDGSRQYFNAGRSSNQGIELTFVYPLSDTVALRSSYAKLLNLADDSFRLSEEQANVMLQYKKAQWNFLVDYEYMSERAYLNSSEGITRVDSFGLLNMHLSYNFTDNLLLSLVGRNIRDSFYESPTLGASTSASPAKGRRMMLSLKWDW